VGCTGVITSRLYTDTVSSPNQRSTVTILDTSASDISLASIVETDSIFAKANPNSRPSVACAKIPILLHSQAPEDGMGPRLSATSATGGTPKPQTKTRGALAGADSSHQRQKSGSSCTSAAAYRSRSDSASAVKAPKPESASPNSPPTNTQPGPEVMPPPPSADVSTAAPSHRAMVSFPLLSPEVTLTAANDQKQQSHAVSRLSPDMTRYYVDTQLDRLWGHQSCGESLDRPIRAQLLQARLISPLGRRVTELVSHHLASYQTRYHELCQDMQTSSDSELDSDSMLYHHYTALAATSLWHASLSRAEAILGADLLDFQMLHLERYLFLYGSYMFTDDGDVHLPGLHRNFWWEAAERKRRWERAFCAIPGNELSTTGRSLRRTTTGRMPDKLRDLYQLILEEPVTAASPTSCPYLPLWQYVAWDATRPGAPACPADVGGADDDSTTAAQQYSRRRALEDLRQLEHRLPPRYAALAPHLRVAIGTFLEANYHGFYEDCVTAEYTDMFSQRCRDDVAATVADAMGFDGLVAPTANMSLADAGGSVYYSAPESSGTNARTSPTDTTDACSSCLDAAAAAANPDTLSTAATAVN
jgi:hypothetical protein